MNTDLTVPQVAHIVKVSAGTVRNRFDAGRLPGYRRANGVRIVPRDDLIRFLTRHGMPLGGLEPYAARPDEDDLDL